MTNFDSFSDICYNLNKEKSLTALGAMNNYMSVAIITFISVFIPLAFTLPTHYPELVELFKFIVVYLLPECLSLYVYLNLRYIEYRSLYEAQLVQSLILRLYLASKENISLAEYISKDYNRILRITSFITSYHPDKAGKYLDIVKHNARMMSFKDKSYLKEELTEI